MTLVDDVRAATSIHLTNLTFAYVPFDTMFEMPGPRGPFDICAPKAAGTLAITLDSTQFGFPPPLRFPIAFPEPFVEPDARQITWTIDDRTTHLVTVINPNDTRITRIHGQLTASLTEIDPVPDGPLCDPMSTRGVFLASLADAATSSLPNLLAFDITAPFPAGSGTTFTSGIRFTAQAGRARVPVRLAGVGSTSICALPGRLPVCTSVCLATSETRNQAPSGHIKMAAGTLSTGAMSRKADSTSEPSRTTTEAGQAMPTTMAPSWARRRRMARLVPGVRMHPAPCSISTTWWKSAPDERSPRRSRSITWARSLHEASIKRAGWSKSSWSRPTCRKTCLRSAAIRGQHRPRA